MLGEGTDLTEGPLLLHNDAQGVTMEMGYTNADPCGGRRKEGCQLY